MRYEYYDSSSQLDKQFDQLQAALNEMPRPPDIQILREDQFPPGSRGDSVLALVGLVLSIIGTLLSVTALVLWWVYQP